MARHYRFFLRNPDTFALFRHEDSFRMPEQLEPEIVFQLVKVLRAKASDVVTLLPMQQDRSGEFFEYAFEVMNVSKNSIGLGRKKVVANTNELGFPLNLWLCIPNKPDKLEFILQKAVEIGVSGITLFEGDFSQMKHQLRTDRLEKIVIEAAEQSERALVPELTVKGNLSKELRGAGSSAMNPVWVAMERLAGQQPRGNPFAGADLKNGMTILVGPEGGFSDAEKKLIDELGLKKFSLGKRVLRMETAAAVSLGLAALLEE